MRGRDPGRHRAHLRDRGPSLRARARHRAAGGGRRRVRGRLRRRARVAGAGLRVAVELRAHGGGRPRPAHLVRVVPLRLSPRAAVDPDQGRGSRGARARRPARPGAADARPGARRVAPPAAPARRPGLRRRGRAGHRGVHPGPPRRRRPARPADRRLRGVLPAVPRRVVRAGGALAAVDGAHGDDLRRPRRHRRLEHLARLGGADARHGLVGRAHRGRLHVLLVLPAPGQPVPRGPRGGRLLPGGPRRRRGRRGHPARLRIPRGPRGGRRTLELPARHRAHAHRDDGLARRARARAWRALDDRRRGVGVHRGVDARRLRPPAAGDLAARLPGTRDALPGGLERGSRRRRLGRAGLGRGRAPAPGPRPRALGRVRRLAARTRAAAGRHRLRTARRPAGERRAALRRRAPRLRGRGAPHGWPAAVAGARLPGRLLAVAQSAGLQREARDQARDDQRRRARRPRPGARGAAWRTSR